MTIQSIVKMGNKQLMSPSLPVTDFTKNFLNPIICDMKDTMKDLGGVGIAAPQIGVNLRIIIYGFEHNDRYPDEDSVPFTILINPTIEPLSKDMEDGWEGCLSVPGLRGLVPRYTKIQYKGLDPEGNAINRIAEGFHARVLQHECDHLDGILYPRRIKDLRYFGFESELG